MSTLNQTNVIAVLWKRLSTNVVDAFNAHALLFSVLLHHCEYQNRLPKVETKIYPPAPLIRVRTFYTIQMFALLRTPYTNPSSWQSLHYEQQQVCISNRWGRQADRQSRIRGIKSTCLRSTIISLHSTIRWNGHIPKLKRIANERELFYFRYDKICR